MVLQLRRDYVARWMNVVDEGSFQAENLKIACWALIDMGIGVATWPVTSLVTARFSPCSMRNAARVMRKESIFVRTTSRPLNY